MNQQLAAWPLMLLLASGMFGSWEVTIIYQHTIALQLMMWSHGTGCYSIPFQCNTDLSATEGSVWLLLSSLQILFPEKVNVHKRSGTNGIFKISPGIYHHWILELLCLKGSIAFRCGGLVWNHKMGNWGVFRLCPYVCFTHPRGLFIQTFLKGQIKYNLCLST